MNNSQNSGNNRGGYNYSTPRNNAVNNRPLNNNNRQQNAGQNPNNQYPPRNPNRQNVNSNSTYRVRTPNQANTNQTRQAGVNQPTVPGYNRAPNQGSQNQMRSSVGMTPRSQSRAPQNYAKSKRESRLEFWKRTFAVSPSELEQHAIVREQGSYDYMFLVIVLILLAFGTIMVYSASYAYANTRYGDSFHIISRHAIFVLFGFFGMGFAMWFRPEWYKKFAPFIYIICFFMLCLVPIPGIGVVNKGARRWISLGFTEIQPSEFMKLGLVFMLAWYFDRYYERVTDFRNIARASFFGNIVPYGITIVTCLLILIEKHVSGTIIMFIIGTLVIFNAGAIKRWMIAAVGVLAAGVSAALLVWPYARARVENWLNPELNPQDGNWQTLQGLYAIGSGGVFGVGITESVQKHSFVSEPQNDFIFTIICEELGMIGAVVVIVLFGLLSWRGLVIAMKAPDVFSSLMVIGIVGKVVVQAMLNIAVVTNTIPNTGISLPFFSYGGSALSILMIEMGVVLSISRFSKQQR